MTGKFNPKPLFANISKTPKATQNINERRSEIKTKFHLTVVWLLTAFFAPPCALFIFLFGL
jgi:hypothetical protein